MVAKAVQKSKKNFSASHLIFDLSVDGLICSCKSSLNAAHVCWCISRPYVQLN